MKIRLKSWLAFVLCGIGMLAHAESYEWSSCGYTDTDDVQYYPAEFTDANGSGTITLNFNASQDFVQNTFPPSGQCALKTVKVAQRTDGNKKIIAVSLKQGDTEIASSSGAEPAIVIREGSSDMTIYRTAGSQTMDSWTFTFANVTIDLSQTYTLVFTNDKGDNNDATTENWIGYSSVGTSGPSELPAMVITGESVEEKTTAISGTEMQWSGAVGYIANGVTLNVTGEAELIMNASEGNTTASLLTLDVNGASAEGTTDSLKLVAPAEEASLVLDINATTIGIDTDISAIEADLGIVTVASGVTLTLDSKKTTWTTIRGEGTVMDISDPVGKLPVLALTFSDASDLMKDTGALNLDISATGFSTAMLTDSSERPHPAANSTGNTVRQISFPEGTNLKTSTIAFWGKQNFHNWSDLFSVRFKRTGTTEEYAIKWEANDNTRYYFGGTTHAFSNEGESETSGTLHHWALVTTVTETATGQTVSGTLYKDGQELSQGKAYTTVYENLATLERISSIKLGGEQVKDGTDNTFADVRVYDAALTEEQIETLMTTAPVTVLSGKTLTVNAGDEANVTVNAGGTLQIVLDAKALLLGYTPVATLSNSGTVTYGTKSEGTFTPITAAQGRVEGDRFVPPAYRPLVQYAFANTDTFANTGAYSGATLSNTTALTYGTKTIARDGTTTMDGVGTNGNDIATINLSGLALPAEGSTVSFWVSRLNTTTTFWDDFFAIQYTDGMTNHSQVWERAGVNTSISIFDATGSQTSSNVFVGPAKVTIADNDNLHHWVVVTKDNTQFFYMDGKPVGNADGYEVANAANYTIAAIDLGGSTIHGRKGATSIADVRVYRTALTEAEIATLYHGGKIYSVTISANMSLSDIVWDDVDSTVKPGAQDMVQLYVADGATLTVASGETLDLSQGKVTFGATGKVLVQGTLHLGENRAFINAADKEKFVVASEATIELTEGPIEDTPIKVTWSWGENVTVPENVTFKIDALEETNDQSFAPLKSEHFDADGNIIFKTTLYGRGAWAEWLFDDGQVEGDFISTGYASDKKLSHGTLMATDYETVPHYPERKGVKIATAKFWFNEGTSLQGGVTSDPIPFNSEAWSTFAVSFFATVPSGAGELFVHFGKIGTSITEGSLALVKGADTDEVLLVRIPGNASENSEILAKMTVPDATSEYHLYTFVRRPNEVDIYLDDLLWTVYHGEVTVADGGFQFGKQVGSFLTSGVENRKSIADSTVTIKNIASDSTAMVDMLRVYNCQLTADETSRIVQEGYAYQSANPLYSRTVTGTADWSAAEGTWTVTGGESGTTYSTAVPCEMARVNLSVNSAENVTVQMNVATATKLESLTFLKGADTTTAGVLTLTASADGAPVTVDGLTRVQTKTVVDMAAVKFSGPVMVVDAAAPLTLKITDALAEAWKSESEAGEPVVKTLTGLASAAPKVLVDTEGVALDNGWTLTVEQDAETQAWVATVAQKHYFVTVSDGAPVWKLGLTADTAETLEGAPTDVANCPVEVAGSGVLDFAVPTNMGTLTITEGANITLNATGADSLTTVTVEANATLLTNIKIATLERGEGATFGFTGETNMTESDFPTTPNILHTAGALVFDRPFVSGNYHFGIGSHNDTAVTQTVTFKQDMTVNRLTTSFGKNNATTVNQEGGTITVTGTTEFVNESEPVLFGHWAGGSTTYNLKAGAILSSGAALLGYAASANVTIGQASGEAAVLRATGLTGVTSSTSTLTLNPTGRLEITKGDADQLGVKLNKDNLHLKLAGGTFLAGATMTPVLNNGLEVSAPSTVAVASGNTLTLNQIVASGTGALTIGETENTGTVALTGAVNLPVTVNATLDIAGVTALQSVKGSGTLAGESAATVTIDATDASAILTLAEGAKLTGAVTFRVPEGTTAASPVLLLKGASGALPGGATVQIGDTPTNLMARYNAEGASDPGYYAVQKISIADGQLPEDTPAAVEQVIINAAAENPAVETITAVTAVGTTGTTTQTVEAVTYFDGILAIGDPDENGNAEATVTYDFGIERMTIATVEGEEFIILSVRVQNHAETNTASFAAGTTLQAYLVTDGGNTPITGTVEDDTDPAVKTLYIPLNAQELQETDTYKFKIDAVKEGAVSITGSEVGFLYDVHPALMPTFSAGGDETMTLLAFTQAGDLGQLTAEQRTTFEVTLTGEGLINDPSLYTLTVDGEEATVTAAPTRAVNTVTLICFGFELHAGSVVKLTTAKANVGASVTIADNSWSEKFNGTSRYLYATLVADKLSTDDFGIPEELISTTKVDDGRTVVDGQPVWSAYSTTIGGSNWLADNILMYRIPAMATNGSGEIVTVFDARYGSGDIGDGRNSGIDLGGNHSMDYGDTWGKAYCAVDVINQRGRNGKWYNGETSGDLYTICAEPTASTIHRTNPRYLMDIGDPSMLYDSETGTYWAMAITGGGIAARDVTTLDCVLYTRKSGIDSETDNPYAWTAWDGGPEGNTRSVKEMLSKSLYETGDSEVQEVIHVDANGEVTYPNSGTGKNLWAFLAGPGHGIQLQYGSRKGWLVFPMQYFADEKTATNVLGRSFAAVSKDNGQTWEATSLTPSGTNAQENCITELDDGSLYMMCKGGTNSANPGDRHFFRGIFDADDKVTWTLAETRQKGINNENIAHVQGSCIRLGVGADGRGRYALAHDMKTKAPTSKFDSDDYRSKLGVIFGRDVTADGMTKGIEWDWEHPSIIHNERTDGEGYNTMCMLDTDKDGKNDTLCVAYEAKHQIVLERIDIRSYLK